jgi:hypothetical protein
MSAVAIKKGQTREKADDFEEMGTLRCEVAARSSLLVISPRADKKIAEIQASWLEKVLAEEHERYKKHPDRIELPD